MAGQGADREQEIDDTEMRYKQLVEGFAKTFLLHGSPVAAKKSGNKERPKTAAPRDLAFKRALLRKVGRQEASIGVDNVKEEKKKNLEAVFSSKAPRRKQEVLIPKKKRIQRRKQSSSDGETLEMGKKIAP